MAALFDSTGSTFNYGDFTAINAFFWSSLDLSPYEGTDLGSTPYWIRAVDGVGKIATGYIGAVGAGETLGDETLTGWTNLVTNEFETFTTDGKDITSAIESTEIGVCYSNTVSYEALALFKIVDGITINSGNNPDLYFGYGFFSLEGPLFVIGSQATGEHTYYITNPSTYNKIQYNAANPANFAATNSLKRVTDPPATAVHIVSSLNGTTRAWESIESGFNPNTITSWGIYNALALLSPSISPSASPSLSPSASESPSKSPSVSPSGSPSVSPSESPSGSPSLSPSASLSPSISPSSSPSVSPSESPSLSPSASVSPSLSPSISPSISPSGSPSVSPSNSPSLSPSASVSPSKSPSVSPSISPSQSPSISPSASSSPSMSPSSSPSESVSRSPSWSVSPSKSYSESPSASPSMSVSKSPSISPSPSPSVSPSASASRSPSRSLSGSPSQSPSVSQSRSPSVSASASPSKSPSKSPSMSYSPSPSASPSVAPSETYSGIAMNLTNKAISTYSGYNFNSIADFNGVILGATATGIRVIGSSSTDGGTAIASNFKTGSMDFGDSFIKHLREIWLAFRAGGVLKFTFSVKEDATTEVEKSTTLTGTKIVEERLKVPRGLRGRFFTIEGENVAGADFDIDSLSMLVESIKRKVR